MTVKSKGDEKIAKINHHTRDFFLIYNNNNKKDEKSES